MKGVWVVSVIASVLILGTFGVQDVYGPEEPEKLNLGGTGYNSDSVPPGFEIKTLVKLPQDTRTTDSYSIFIEVAIFKPDGTPLRAVSDTFPVPSSNLPAEGGQNSHVQKFVTSIPYTPLDSDPERARIFVSGVLSLDGVLVDTAAHWGDVTLKRGRV